MPDGNNYGTNGDGAAPPKTSLAKLRDNGDGAEMFKARLNICACKKLDPVPLCPAASLFNASIRVDIFTPSPFVSEQQHRSVSPQNAKIFSVMRKKRANRLRASTFYAIITKQTRYALMVKRLRRRPLTAESGVRFPMRVPMKKHRMLGVFSCLPSKRVPMKKHRNLGVF